MAHGHSHGHAHGHGHDHLRSASRSGARHRGALGLSLALVATFGLAQFVVGVITGSLALLSDAGHMATDALGLGMALAAIRAASASRRHPRRTFGLYRLEVLAALGNSLLLFGVAGYVVYEAVARIGDLPEVAPVPVLVLGLVGLAVNVVAFLLLREGSRESINIRGAYLEVVADTLGSVAVVVGALAWWATGWTWVDPVLGAGIGLFIVPRAWRLGADALRILVQMAPLGIDPVAVQADLEAIPGVVDVHDLHIWTLTSDMEVLSAHVRVHDGTDSHGVLDAARDVLDRRHGVAHATLQVEPQSHEGCEQLDW